MNWCDNHLREYFEDECPLCKEKREMEMCPGDIIASDYTKPEVAVQLDLHRRANFAREWPTMPRQLRVRLRALQRFPTENNHSSCSGFIAGYAAAQPGAFSDAYAQALAYALFCKYEWVHDEVKHASLLD